MDILNQFRLHAVKVLDAAKTWHEVAECKPDKQVPECFAGTLNMNEFKSPECKSYLNLSIQIQSSAIANNKNGKGTLCPEDASLLEDWRLNSNLTESIAEFLTLAGWNELQSIATRYQRVFPTLLPKTYSRSKYLFQHSDTQRTQASFRAFADGLFGYNGYQQVAPEPIPARDLLLRVSS